MMKNSLTLLFVLVPFLVFSQPCQSPMPANIFRQKLNQLALQPNDQQKLQYSKTLLQGSCLLGAQVKELALVFFGDYYRLEFCKRAWKHTFDPENFFEVYDTFTSLSSALRLYHSIYEVPEPIPVNRPPIQPMPVPWYPDLAYPTPVGYKGITGCPLPLADKDFEVLCRPAVLQKSDASRRNEGIRLVETNCITMGQAMKLATLFELESNRLTFMKEIFTRLYDAENYSFATEVFSHLPYKNDWIAYCGSIVEQPAPVQPAPVCEVTASEFDDIKRSIGKVSVNSTRLALAKQVISSKKCFTVRQIAEITGLFSVESSRLELILFAYDYCINKGDYYQLTESLYTTSSKDKLLEFINSHK